LPKVTAKSLLDPEPVHAPGLPRAQTIQRAVAVLRAVSASSQGATVGEVAADVRLPRPTVSRLLATLSDAALVEHVPDGRWVLGSEFARLARAAEPYRRIVELARPIVVEVAAQTGESATLGAGRRPGEAEVLVQADAPSLIGATNWVGRRFPAHASAGGKCALVRLDEDELEQWLATHPLEQLTARTISNPGRLRAELDRVRRLGYAETIDELEEGLTGIAVPVRGPDPNTAMALTVSGPSPRFPPRRRRQLATLARAAAARLAAVLEVEQRSYDRRP
jgi:DNA-binding IclR family transcriptional regulator